jgi:hypothetical protein
VPHPVSATKATAKEKIFLFIICLNRLIFMEMTRSHFLSFRLTVDRLLSYK